MDEVVRDATRQALEASLPLEGAPEPRTGLRLNVTFADSEWDGRLQLRVAGADYTSERFIDSVTGYVESRSERRAREPVVDSLYGALEFLEAVLDGRVVPPGSGDALSEEDAADARELRDLVAHLAYRTTRHVGLPQMR